MIQHFMEGEVCPRFCSQSRPQLYYMGKILPELSSYPRIMHSHANHVEISIIYSGTSRYMIRDNKQLIRPGDVIIYNSNTVHDELSSAETQIGSYFFAVGNLELPGLRPNALIPDDCDPVFHIGKDFDKVIELCESMLGNLDHPCEWSKYITHYLTQALLEIIWGVIHTPAEPQGRRGNYYLGQKIKEYIDKRYCEPLTVKKMCEDLRLSESYVSHVFKDMLGYSPMQYILRRKIGEAQTLLISTDYPISQIARMVGFDAQSHFNQRFSKYVGISPSQFRKNYKEKGAGRKPSPKG
ncbi:helix-turn-helix domain-containing protein [Intestinibacillus massiliensis]|uniref:helix-turn-helix domain-containing protein n=1 Tax=Intestinibacillus massiliensis TaxID=1871029 RepID=UPI000B352DCD|nr:AraC family transcriptional regulator [Intestinibacillus massiliensis]